MAKRIVKGNMNENDERNEIIKAAEQGHAEWAEKAMERVWSDET